MWKSTVIKKYPVDSASRREESGRGVDVGTVEEKEVKSPGEELI